MKTNIFNTLLKYQLPALLWAIFIFVLCTSDVAGDGLGPLFGFIPMDKVAHFVLFGMQLLLLLLGKYYSQNNNLFDAKKILFLILVLIYGGFIEIYQHYYTLNRHGDWWDLLADGAGALFILFAFHFLKRKR